MGAWGGGTEWGGWRSGAASHDIFDVSRIIPLFGMAPLFFSALEG